MIQLLLKLFSKQAEPIVAVCRGSVCDVACRAEAALARARDQRAPSWAMAR